MTQPRRDIRSRTFWRTPGSAAHLAPPRRRRHSVLHQFIEALLWDMRPEDKGPAEPLRLGSVVRLLHKPAEERVGDWNAVNPKLIQRYISDRPFTVVWKCSLIVGTHQKWSTGKS